MWSEGAVSDASAPASGENGITLKGIAASAGILYCRGCILTSVSCAYLNSFLTPLWDRSRPYAAGSGHDDESISPSRKYVQQADPRKDQATVLGSSGPLKFRLRWRFWTCTAVCRFSGDSDGGRPVFGVTLPFIIRHDAAVLQDLLEGRDIQHGVRLPTMVGTLLAPRSTCGLEHSMT